MIPQLIAIIALTFVIHFIGTLSYAVRLVSIRTHKVALTLSLFNILVLVSRTANSFQAPLVSKIVETDLNNGVTAPRADWFALIIASSTVATLAAMLAIPSFQRLLAHAVEDFSRFKSVPRLLRKAISLRSYRTLHGDFTLPRRENLRFGGLMPHVSWKYVFLNLVSAAVITVGVLASLYAGYLGPDYRVTASSLSSIINGVATIFLFVFIDPYLSMMVDDTINGRMSEAVYRRYMVLLLLARAGGTVLAQFLLWPAAWLIAQAARFV